MTDVNLNMDFTKPTAIKAEDMEWTPSLLPGVERRQLARENAESGHATSIVRYVPGSSFSEHVHGNGEEFLVIDGVFSDEGGHYGKGTYVRNPPGSRHAPYSKDGCTIFVKLCQMQPEGEPAIVAQIADIPWRASQSKAHRVKPLFCNEHETVRLEMLKPGAVLIAQDQTLGLEILVLKGYLQAMNEVYGPFSWLRLPPGFDPNISTNNGCEFWAKRNHLGKS